MPSRAIKAAGTRWPTCASCTNGAIIGIINGWDTKQPRLEPDAEQSARPVLRGAPDSNAVAPTRLRLRPHALYEVLRWTGDHNADATERVAGRGEGPLSCLR